MELNRILLNCFEHFKKITFFMFNRKYPNYYREFKLHNKPLEMMPIDLTVIVE